MAAEKQVGGGGRRSFKRQGFTRGDHRLRALSRPSCATVNPLVAMVRNRHLPGLRPSFIADPIVQSEHRIDVGSFPMHPSPLQTSFDHEFVGTFHHARTNRPPILAEGG